MGKYKKCPRCDLNYILQDEEMCDVCKAELGLESKIVLLDDIMDDEETLKLCPVCHTAYISIDEKMCESCLAAEQQAHEAEIGDEDDDSWRTYLDDDDTKDANEEQVDIPLEDLDKEFENEDEEDEDDDETYDDLDDDLDYVTGSDLDDDDFDDEEDDEDEE